MDTKNTVAKGNAFEDKVFDILSTVLDNDDFFVSGRKSKIFKKKGYFSAKRNANIIFDITIETYLDSSPEYSILTIIECKTYSSSIPINDIEEFDSKIRQVGEHNTKGVVVSNSVFQEGAYNFAKANGIGLIRVLGDDEYQWIIRRADKQEEKNNEQNFIIETATEVNLDKKSGFFATVDGVLVNSISELLLHLKVIDKFKVKSKFVRLPYRSDASIDDIVKRLEGYDIYTGYMLDEAKLCKFIKARYPVEFVSDRELANGALGKIEFLPLKIYVSKSLEEDTKRRRFTLCHEIGHLILHAPRLEKLIAETVDDGDSLFSSIEISDIMSRRLEKQANYFAGSLLIPKTSLNTIVNNYFTENLIQKRFLYWDGQPQNRVLVKKLFNLVSFTFQVSITVAKIRLMSLRLVREENDKLANGFLTELKL